ncbi:MAG: bacteriocin family protein [Oscillospiraceae bacterium]|jgi:uncharacterized linocin/CFP29 family protein|nr:bacteriocin family protein [Oscillospiraceae bacterium]MCI1990599.1 bacteriocin family protein [Oscillospiraceae bacterium]MCI2035979.1 bacteriocin family protein [Oscillospiraceae bacterium]
MSYLSREVSPLPGKLWEQIDGTVVKTARRVLTGRRFLPVFGPLGIGVSQVAVDRAGQTDEAEADGLLVTKGRRYVELPTVYADFTLLAKDLESSAASGLPLDLSNAAAAAEACALKEDRLIFFGSAENGYEGLLTAQGVGKVAKGDWGSGENAYADVAAAVESLVEKNVYGSYTLAVSPDLYGKLQRIQPGTGVLEADRIAKLLDGRLYRTPVLGKDKAVLVGAEGRYVDLAVGQDIATAYLEQKDLNHRLRVLETVLLRIKSKEAIVVFE